jgi:transposase InsO family protein
VFDNIAIDVIMGLPKSEDGNTNLMVIIDTFSRYIELYPMQALTAKAAAKALHQWMCRYGRPRNILTDNASQFQGEYESTLKVLGIRNEKIHPYSHEENAIVERANREIIRHLRNILYETKIHKEWEDHIPDIQRIKN